MKTTPQHEKVRRLFYQLCVFFGVDNFDIKIHWMKEDEENMMADITYDEKYQTIDLRIRPRFLTESKADQRKILLHEVCHSITTPSKEGMVKLHKGNLITPDEIRNINERETSRIENIVDMLLTNDKLKTVRMYRNYCKRTR